jgi:hypothetical protein
MSWASQAAEKLVRAVGQGFIPGTKATESAPALAAEVCLLPILPENKPFSAASLAPAVLLSVICNSAAAKAGIQIGHLRHD